MHGVTNPGSQAGEVSTVTQTSEHIPEYSLPPPKLSYLFTFGVGVTANAAQAVPPG